MRMMLKVTIPVEAGNAAIKDGRLPKTLEETMDRLKPESAYFVASHGMRSAYFFFDMKDSSDIPTIAEPLFINLNAQIELQPAMNAADLQQGLHRAFAGSGR